jgi:endogenous inhibitor of DNA gyrase (YacG/DUF329 family)
MPKVLNVRDIERGDMGVIINMKDKVYCPLCEEAMSKREIMVHGKYATVFFCRHCAVGTFDFDPAFNKWRDTDKEIPCPACGNAVKWFARYIDGYFKSKCPKCGIGMEKDGDVKFGDHGNIIIPEDMEPEETEEPVHISIPVHALKRLVKDKQNELRNKLRNQKNQSN